ncbi:MAG: two-component system response regulator [Mesoaciditoga sp.]|uniref:response regulator n=1 Tax=Athalassotoga sp. TaxID=2022597 RepID=UPI000CC8026F|nr:MAG: two-component system response regulator [Mesoaciditoga sp.]HEU25106.1 response regulator [Mesoaciditoga lauensis]
MAKVLVVDDSDVLRKIAIFNLSRAGFEVHEAMDGLMGIEKIIEVKPDVVILDIMMPKLDGFQVLEKVKKDPQLNTVKFIVLTAKGGDTDLERAKKLGAEEFMTKPFSPKALVEAVVRLASR